MIRVVSERSAVGVVGGPWFMEFHVPITDPTMAEDAPVVTVTLPDGVTTATPEVEQPSPYCYRYQAWYTPLVAGRFTARAVTAENGVADLLLLVITASASPTAADLDDWLGGETEHSWTDADLTAALAAETLAQMRVCRVPATYPPDLHEALLRRAARSLAMRRQLTAEPRGEGDVDLPAVLSPYTDPEIRRLEKPYRRIQVG